VQESGELSAEVAVLLGSSSIPEHDSSVDARVLGVHGLRDGLQSGGVDVAFAGGRRRSRSADENLDVLVDRGSLSPVGPRVEVELAGIVVESAVVVVELNKDVVEPAIGESESRLRSEPVVRVRALRSAGNVVGLRGGGKVSSELVDKVSIASRRARFDVEIDSVEDGGTEGANVSVSSQESVPNKSGKSLSLGSGSETVIAFGAS